MYPFIMQGKNLVIVIGTNTHTINPNHLAYQKILEAIKSNDWETIKDLVEPKNIVLNYGRGNILIEGDRLFWKGEELNNFLSDKIIQMYKEGFPIEPMVLFMENLMQNPSKRAVTELYSFLEKGQLPITPDGHFLAYKKVLRNYHDVYSGKIDNSVGKVVTMERNKVDDDKDRTCSTGLHFCSKEYLNHFGGDRIMILKINPMDVVSIPSDYGDAKGRCCRYEVIAELGVDPYLAFTNAVQETANTY